MADKPDENASDDSAFRHAMSESGYKPDASGMKWGPAQPKILVAGAYKVIRSAAEKARQITGRNK